MKVLGITGGVGAGKSTVLEYLREARHARVIQADQVAHMVQKPGQECYERILREFGADILREDGMIDREKLGTVVYRDTEKLGRLNGIVHPAVKAYIVEQIRLERAKEKAAGKLCGHPAPFVAVEAALLLEDRYDLICDEIWYIYADEKTRARRLKASRGYSEEKIRNVMANQLKEDMYRSKCNFEIDNSGHFVENTFEQIDKGLREHGFL